MRLIDADKLLEYRTDRGMINVRLIYSAPTVEAEPIRHGHWVDTGESERYGLDHELAIRECDQCGEIVWVHLKDPRRWNYCPNCGADMRGGVI